MAKAYGTAEAVPLSKTDFLQHPLQSARLGLPCNAESTAVWPGPACLLESDFTVCVWLLVLLLPEGRSALPKAPMRDTH